MDQNLPIKFGKYTLIKHLATGGMAELYLALQRSISGFEKLIVIKKILPRYSADEEFIKMFLDEARIAATLNHPNIVQIFDVGSIGQDYFIAMEYIHGEDLRNIVGAMKKKQMKFFPLEHAIAIIIGVCKGLYYAHNHRNITGEPLNIVHRDISPQNILVTFSGEVKVVDFGIARAVAKDSFKEGKEGSGALRGKFPYMSPEQVKGLPLDKRSDIFSLGIVLYELTTGRRLFKGANEIETLRKIVELEYPKPSSLIPDYPPGLEKIVMTALQKDRDLRYQEALNMQQELEDFVRLNNLKVSTIQLGKFMEELFQEKLMQEKEALKEGKRLADIIAEKEVSSFSIEEFLDLSSIPSSGGTTSKSLAMDSSISSVLAMPEKRSKKNIIVITVISIFVVIFASLGGILTYKFLKSSAEESLKIGMVRIKTDPAGAIVYLDGDRVPGETPLELKKLKPDVRYLIEVKMPGYEPVSREVSVTSKAPNMELDLKLTQIKTAGMAVLKIETNHPESNIFLDGKKLDGKGSITVDSIKPDIPHIVFIQAPEYMDYNEKLVLSPGEIKELKVQLKPKPIGSDEFVLVLNTDPDGASVLVEGKQMEGKTPGRWRLPWQKSLKISIIKERFKEKEILINPSAGKEYTINEKLEKKKSLTQGGVETREEGAGAQATGILYLNSEPWSNVTIAGVGKFQTPIANLKVPAGNLKITLENPPSGLKQTITINIPPGGIVRKMVTLK